MALATVLAAKDPADLEQGFQLLAAQIDATAAAAPVALFLSLSDGQSRASVLSAQAASAGLAWQRLLERLDHSELSWPEAWRWLRLDWATDVRKHRWGDLLAELQATKRNYYPRGLAWDPALRSALLEGELLGHGLLYASGERCCTPHPRHLERYSLRRFGQPLRWPDHPDQPFWSFETRAVIGGSDGWRLLEHRFPYRGFRRLEPWSAGTAAALVHSATSYLAQQVDEQGRFCYGRWPCFDRPIPGTNTLRQCSSIYSLWEGWQLTGDPLHRQAAERAQQHVLDHAIHPSPNGGQVLREHNGELKLGGTAAAILAFGKASELTAAGAHSALIQSLAQGLLAMGRRPDGGLNHVLSSVDGSVLEPFRVIYYDGEALYALLVAHRACGDPALLHAAIELADVYDQAEHWRAHDHWLAYGFAELYRLTRDIAHLRFALRNLEGRLSFIRGRITTYPTLLELCMATRALLESAADDPAAASLLASFDCSRMERALQHRARYLANGFFFPEVAMYMERPASVAGSFFIRHHAFRSRIDDNAHYISGLSAYVRQFAPERVVIQPQQRPRLCLLLPQHRLDRAWAAAMEQSIALAVSALRHGLAADQGQALLRAWLDQLPSGAEPEALTPTALAWHQQRQPPIQKPWGVRELADLILASAHRRYAWQQCETYWRGTHFKTVPVGVPRTRNRKASLRHYTPHGLPRYARVQPRLRLGEMGQKPIYLSRSGSGDEPQWTGRLLLDDPTPIALTTTTDAHWLHPAVADLERGWTILQVVLEALITELNCCATPQQRPQVLLDGAAQLHWWFSQLMPYRRGSAAVADMLVRTLLDAHGLSTGPWAPGVAPDVEALVEPLEHYVQIYPTLFAEPPLLAHRCVPTTVAPLDRMAL